MPYKLAQLPPELKLDAAVQEAMAFRREPARRVHRKIASGARRSHENGQTRLIEWASIIEDRDRCVAFTVLRPARPRRRPRAGPAPAPFPL